MGTLLIARHHESEWNKRGIWTGSRDVHLTPYGFEMSAKMGLLVKEFHIDQAFASMQVRSHETLSSMLEVMEQYKVPTEYSAALNERDYGDYTGKNKWEMKELIGETEFDSLRREWDYPVPHGETLKMVYERAQPYFVEHILPALRSGKNVLIVSHGNAIRALMKYIENIPDAEIRNLEMLFGSVLIYTIDSGGRALAKEIRQTASEVNA